MVASTVHLSIMLRFVSFIFFPVNNWITLIRFYFSYSFVTFFSSYFSFSLTEIDFSVTSPFQFLLQLHYMLHTSCECHSGRRSQVCLVVVYVVMCSFEENTVFVTTPPVNDTARHLAIKVVLNDWSEIHTKRTFEYRSNPSFSDIRPRSHLTL